MRLAVQHLRREAQQILPMEFVGDARERVHELVGFVQFEIAAAAVECNLAQAWIRFRRFARHVGPAVGYVLAPATPRIARLIDAAAVTGTARNNHRRPLRNWKRQSRDAHAARHARPDRPRASAAAANAAATNAATAATTSPTTAAAALKENRGLV